MTECQDCRERRIDQDSRRIDARAVGLLIEHGPARLFDAGGRYSLGQAERVLRRELAALDSYKAGAPDVWEASGAPKPTTLEVVG